MTPAAAPTLPSASVVATAANRWTAVAAILRLGAQLAGRINLRAAVMLAAIVTGIVQIAIATPVAIVRYDVPIAPAFILVVLHGGSIPLAVLRPKLAVGVSIAASVALQLFSASAGLTHVWPWWIPLMVTQVAVVFVIGLCARWTTAVAGWVLGVGVSSVLEMLLRHGNSDATSLNVVIFAAISGGALVLALVIAQWRAIRMQLIRERRISAEEFSLRVLADERARIARELHDVIAHSMSLITVQATTARYRHPDFDEAAIAEFAEIGASSKQALDEMRGLLGVLRDGDHPGARKPQPRFSDIPELIAQAERAGMRVTFDGAATDRTGVNDLTGLAAYRIVQEALSNVIRHAPGTDVRVTCRPSGENLVLSIENSAPGTPGALVAPGHGLIGMSERATGVAGRVAFGPTADGGFSVRAVLPMRGTLPAGRGGA